MHYPPKLFSRYNKPTIRNKKGTQSFGWRGNLSPIDVKQVNAAYQCNAEPKYWYLQQSNVCISAKGNRPGVFSFKSAGRLNEIKLVHRSGQVSCMSGHRSIWGCYSWSHGKTIGIIVTNSNDEIVLPDASVIEHAGGWWASPTQHHRSSQLVLRPGKPLEVAKGTNMKAWYAEDLKNHSEENNSGQVCADVYANFKGMSFPIQQTLAFNHLIATIPVLKYSYIVIFEVNPSKFQPGWSNVIHLTTGGNCCEKGQRMPGVWFHSASTTLQDTVNKLLICSAVTDNGNYCVSTPKNIKKGVWTSVEISQRLEESNYKYRVKVGGVLINSADNINVMEFKNVKVYASRSTPQPGHIRNLFIDPEADEGVSGASVYPDNRQIIKGYALSTIPTMTSSYTVSFEVNPSKFQSGWSNVIHLSTGGNCCKKGQRIPGVWFYSASPTDTVNKLMICSAVADNGNYCVSTPKNIKKVTWTKVEINQGVDGPWHKYAVKVGVLLRSIANKKMQDYKNVKVFVSNTYSKAQPGHIRNLLISPRESVGLPKKWFYPLQQEISRGNHLTTIPVLSASYIVKFQVNPSKFQKGWSNVIHLSARGNWFVYGDRTPAVFFHGATSDTENKFYICSAVNDKSNYCYSSQNVKKGVWCELEISQRLVGSKYIYSVKVGDAEAFSVFNNNAKEFENVKVYVANPWGASQPGNIRNLFIDPEADG